MSILGVASIISGLSSVADLIGRETKATKSTTGDSFSALLERENASIVKATAKPATTTPAHRAVANAAALGAANPTAAQEFKDYLRKDPMERMVEEWLKAHNMTMDSFKALPADQQAALRTAMAEDLKKQVESGSHVKGNGRSTFSTMAISS